MSEQIIALAAQQTNDYLLIALGLIFVTIIVMCLFALGVFSFGIAIMKPTKTPNRILAIIATPIFFWLAVFVFNLVK